MQPLGDGFGDGFPKPGRQIIHTDHARTTNPKATQIRPARGKLGQAIAGRVFEFKFALNACLPRPHADPQPGRLTPFIHFGNNSA